MNYLENKVKQFSQLLTACEILSPVNVTTHFKRSCGTVRTNLSCLRPSLPYKGTGNRWAHSYHYKKKNKKSSNYLSICYLKSIEWLCVEYYRVRTTRIVWRFFRTECTSTWSTHSNSICFRYEKREKENKFNCN